MTKRLLVVTTVALLALGACGDDDDTASETTTSTTEATTTTTETPPETTTTAAPEASLVDAAETARAWIAEVGGGDVDDAIALTSARALEAIGGEAGFRDNEIALAEGWGAWDFAEDLEVTAVSVDDSLAVVVLHGELSQEGPPEESWAAIPVVATPDGDRVEPFVDLGEVTIDPPANSDVEPNPVVTIDVPDGLELVVGWDALGLGPTLEGEIHSTEALEPGLHSFVVLLRDAVGGVMARTFLYGV